jgi:hypothetical protein
MSTGFRHRLVFRRDHDRRHHPPMPSRRTYPPRCDVSGTNASSILYTWPRDDQRSIYLLTMAQSLSHTRIKSWWDRARPSMITALHNRGGPSKAHRPLRRASSQIQDRDFTRISCGLSTPHIPPHHLYSPFLKTSSSRRSGGVMMNYSS